MTTGTTSFQRDILPLFTQTDIDHMAQQGVTLNDYSYMSDPTHAAGVHQQVSQGLMPPPDSGENRWSSDMVALFQAWIDGGYQP
ncbi:MAG: hypothetical protein JO063_12445 [Pseudonocardiales bacterium]|nr:hypothetical protein [Pseudonocardiales bacterium]MBV9029337.1 hypothetical protein [Pseudonocardiales bacterium]MBW0010899.1 hypothetical protein [Pseudonocardiales bacterium]